jgi:hypothetical protein
VQVDVEVIPTWGDIDLQSGSTRISILLGKGRAGPKPVKMHAILAWKSARVPRTDGSEAE